MDTRTRFAKGNMEIKEQKQGGVTIIALRGRLDAYTSPTLESRIQAILDQGGNRLVFDFSELAYISSLGLRVLIVAAKNLQKIDGKIALAALSEHIHDIFKMSGFTRIFPIYATCEQAVVNCAS